MHFWEFTQNFHATENSNDSLIFMEMSLIIIFVASHLHE